MKKSIYFILILSLFLLYIGTLNIPCQKIKGKKEEGNVKVIINKGDPQNPSLSLIFKEDLSITKKGWWPADIAVDNEGIIYVFGEGEKFIYKFDPQGNEILKKVFTKGEGPGDFYFMDPYFSADGRLFIYDKLNQRMTILNDDCEIIETLQFREPRFLFQQDSKGNIYFFVSRILPEISETADRAYKKVLTKFSPSGILLDELFEFDNPRSDIDREKMIYYWPLYYTCGMYKLDSDDNLYYAMSDKYEISVVSLEGKLSKRIIKKGQSRKATKRDIEIVTPPENNTSRRYKFEYIIPKHVPYIADFFILDNKFILVITHENDYDKETLAGDLFNEKGIFQNRVEVPKYYQWWNNTEFYGLKKKALYRKDHFYIIDADKSEENFYVKRYKIVWTNKIGETYSQVNRKD